MKKQLSEIVITHGYRNVKAFQQEYAKSKAEYGWYKQETADWELM